ncbi:MAG TPA: PhoPQ-activated protein PqaA family protein [Planctomycetaceae bacterium]|jgi:PhoPQ-activated pathogenicity-related protein|nr:PhoPQ-activated protein PqaA family protein [Planctomycetaceae bacterium]
MRLECWYARFARSFPTSRRSSAARNRQRRLSSRRLRWGIGAALSRIELLEDRALLSGTPGGSSTLPTLTPSQQTALDTYVAAADSSYHFSLNSTLTGTGYTDYVINMVSQTWTPSPGDSQVWQHWVQIIVPTTVSTHTAVLNISGGTNSSTAPTSPDAQSLATATTLNAITVFLPTVPNEPVTFPAQGETTPLTEDQIVAYTFEQFLDGNGQDWPLLLPMVKSAVRAMDTTQSFVSSQSGGTLSVDNFIVTGASKRGWTTWLTPAVDTRVVAIVPYVFDGLNLADQVESQLDTYVGVTQDTVNGDSTAVQDYTGDGVFNFFGTPQMSSLLSIVDPYAYIGRSTYNIPKYLIDSTGDQFFVPGAQFYFSNLPGENYLRYIPNTDHGLDTDAVVGGIDFEKALLDGASLPQFTWNVSNSGTTITLNSVTTPSSVTMWQATNTTNRDFRLETFGANWTSSTLTDQGGGTYVAQVTPPTTGATDFFVQMQYTVDGMTLTFTTQISTVPLLTPAVTVTDNTGSYDGNPFAATATATGRAGLPVPGTFSFDYYNGPNPIGTPFTTPPTQFGTYTVVASFASSDPDYAGASSQPLTFQILKDTPVLTLTDAGGPYSDTPYPATATIAGVVTGVDDTPGGSLEGVPVTIEYFANGSTTPLSGAPTTAGAYNAIASFNGSQDYFGTAKQIFFQIAHDTPILTVSDAGGPYNDSPYPATATIAGVIPGVDDTPGSSLEGVPVTVTYYANGSTTPLSGAPTTAGAYNLVASFNGSQDYLDFAKQIFFRIAQDTPVLTASAAGGPYVDAPYPATATIAGVIPGVDDTPGSTLEGVPLTFTYYTNGSTTPLSGAPTSPGQYNVLVSFNGSQDYLDAAKQVLFQITPAQPVLTASDAGGPYVDAPYPATATIAGVIPGVDDTPGSSLEGVPITFTYYTNGSTTPLSGAPTSPGQYNVLAVFNGSQDYFSAVKQIFFQITPALPVLTASDGGGPYTDAPYPATATIAGVISGVDNTPGSSLEGVPLTFAYYANPSTTPLSGAPTAAGFYNVVVSFNGSQDYFALSKQVFFQITQDQPVISLSDVGGTFDGRPFPATATIAGLISGVDNTPSSSLEGVPLSVSYFLGATTSGTLLSGVPTNAGQYTALAAFAGSTDYEDLMQSVTFQIGQATPTVVANDAGGNFTGNPFPASATATGVGGAILSGTFGFTYYVGSTVNGNGSSTAPSAAGTYTVVAAFTSSDANYVTGPTNSLPVVFTIKQLGSPPSIVAPATASVAENTALVFSSGTGNAISITDANAGSSVEQLTLTVTNGTLRLAATMGLTITSGSNNSASMTVTGTLANLNAALNGLQFMPTTGYSGPASLSVTFKDLGNNQSASATVAMTVVAPPVTVNLLTFLPIVVPGEPVPFIISARDTIPGAQFGPFKINISFGDGNAATFSAGILPILVNHIYRQVGTFTVTVTATDQFGNTSLPATVVIRVISLRVGFNPLVPNQTALIIGETPGNSYSFGAAANGGITVTINGVSQGVFNVTGPVIVLGQQGKQPVNQSYGFSNRGLLVETPTVDSLESNLDSEALQWAGLSAATEILNE